MEQSPSGQAWYEVWFDSPHYHMVYGHRSQAEADAFIQKMHGMWGWGTLDLLDLACGKGRHAKAAAALGHRVTGLDLSPNSIREARAMSAGTSGLTFIEGDMLDFELSAKFDGVLNLFTSFGYFASKSELIRVLENIHRHLKHNGFLVLDYLDAAFARKYLTARETMERNGVTYTIEREIQHDAQMGWDIFVKRIHHDEGGVTVQHEERVAALTEVHLRELLEATGFQVVGQYGNYSLDPWVEGESPRLIIKAEKA